MNILLEAIEEKNRATIEAVFASKRELEDKMERFHQRAESRFEIVEAAIRQTNTKVDRIETALQETNTVVKRIEAKLDTKADAEQVKRLEKRVEQIESAPRT